MRHLVALAVALSLAGCSRYETRTADGVTIRTDTATGKTELLTSGPDGAQWKPITEGKTSGACVEPRPGQGGLSARTQRRLGLCN